MLTHDEARQLVTDRVCVRPDWLPQEDEIVIVDEATIERPWGWVFFHASKKWMETHDVKYAIAGSAPMIVERQTGRILSTGTAHSVERYIETYERTGSPHE